MSRSNKELIISILQKQLGLDCELIGPEILDEVATRAADGSTAEVITITGGTNWDLAEVLKVVVQAATFVSAGINIVRYLNERKHKDQVITIDELRNAIIAQLGNTNAPEQLALSSRVLVECIGTTETSKPAEP